MSPLLLFPMSIVSHLSGTSRPVSTGIHLVISCFSVPIKSFFQTENTQKSLSQLFCSRSFSHLQKICKRSLKIGQRLPAKLLSSPGTINFNSIRTHWVTCSYITESPPWNLSQNALAIMKSLSHVNRPTGWHIFPIFLGVPHTDYSPIAAGFLRLLKMLAIVCQM